MKQKFPIMKSVAKAKQLFQKMNNQKWFKKVIRQVLSYFIRNHSADFLTWSKDILELIFNSF